MTKEKEKTIIEITLKEKSDYQNKFNDKNLSNELSNYIYEECHGTAIINNIKLVVYSNNTFTEKEQKDFYEKIHKNFGTMVKEEKLLLKYNNYMEGILFFIGVILISASYLLNNIEGFIFSEIILIIAWLSIWESASTFLFENTKKRIKIRRLKKLAECEIEFKKEN